MKTIRVSDAKGKWVCFDCELTMVGIADSAKEAEAAYRTHRHLVHGEKFESEVKS